ncbi:response regulator [Rhodoferax sp.]|uniref:response regulator transcription factor n=1 Tax=Rhodoferax sp. TaxID=50421 RepID=UPI00374DC1FC
MLRQKAARVLIVESDSAALLQLANAVQQDTQLSLAAAVSTGTAAMALMGQNRPDVLVIDVHLPDISAMEVIRYAAGHFQQMEVVVLTQFGNDEQVLSCIEAGATSYLFKSIAVDELAPTIHAALAGGAPISPGMARRVLGRFRLRPGVDCGSVWAGPQRESGCPLSASEAGILRWIARGMTLEQIAELASSSQQSVLIHVKQIYRKLTVYSRGEAMVEDSEADAALCDPSLRIQIQ